MIEACLKNKIISKFLKNYKEKKWISIIPSLLEIAILNLYNNFKKTYFSEKDLSSIIKNLSNPNKLNKLRNNCHLDILDFLYKRRYSHQNSVRNSKNINELNVYTSKNKDDKLIHYTNKSSHVTPIKRLINYCETEENLESSKFKAFKKFNKILNTNKINNKNINAINYNTIDINDTNRNEGTYLSYNSSIFLDNNSNRYEKEYIKVNKAQKTKKLKKNKVSVEDIKMKKINNTYMDNNIKEDIRNKIDKINKNSRVQLLNNFKQEDIHLNKKFSDNEKEKNNKTSFYHFPKQKVSANKLNSSSTIKYRSIGKDSSINDSKKIMIRNIYNKINLKKITIKEIRNKQFTNLKKDIKDNNEAFQNINPQLIINDEKFKNISDINFDSNIKSEYNNSKNKRKFKVLKENKKNNIINYNSFNSDYFTTNRTFINDPYFLINPIKKKSSIIRK